MLGVTAYALGPDDIATAQPVVLLWLAFGTALAQVLAWTLEGVRRVPHGIVGVRLLTVVVFGVALGLQLSNNVAQIFDRLPSVWFVVGMNAGFSWRWAMTVGVVFVALRVLRRPRRRPATIAAHRRRRATSSGRDRPPPGPPRPSTVLGGMVRIDRGSVWRAVPMRRGAGVLAIGPGVVALLGDLQWDSMTILPGLVASGGALLYGVNAWCLDSRGALWRESLPVAPAPSSPPAPTCSPSSCSPPRSSPSPSPACVPVSRRTPAPVALVCTLVVVTAQVAGAVDAVVGAPSLRRRPSLGASHPGTPGDDGRLLHASRALDHRHRPVLLRTAVAPDCRSRRSWRSRSWPGRCRRLLRTRSSLDRSRGSGPGHHHRRRGLTGCAASITR